MQVIDLPASAGAAWIKMSFAIFRAQPAGWISLVVAWLMLSIALHFFPFYIGQAVATILVPGFFAGFIIAARDQEAGKPVGMHQLFGAFRVNGRALITLGAITLLVDILLMVLFAALDLPQTIPKGADGKADYDALRQSLDGKTWSVLASFALVVAIKGALWFTAALLALNQMPVTHAIRWSCYALIANFLPMLVFGALMMCIFMLAIFPLLLGFLVATPMYAIAHYVSYRDLFRPSAEA